MLADKIPVIVRRHPNLKARRRTCQGYTRSLTAGQKVLYSLPVTSRSNHAVRGLRPVKHLHGSRTQPLQPGGKSACQQPLVLGTTIGPLGEESYFVAYRGRIADRNVVTQTCFAGAFKSPRSAKCGPIFFFFFGWVFFFFFFLAARITQNPYRCLPND